MSTWCMSESDDLNAAENALRDLIERVFAVHHPGGLTAAALGVTDDRLAKWLDAKEIESKRRDGVRPEERLLYFAEFSDLLTIINRSWALFLPCFGDKQKLNVYLTRLVELRNPVAHSRHLVPFEQHLVAGMTGEIRQQVTLYLSTMSDERQHFPRIERVEDSFGNVGHGRATSGSGHVALALVLHPDDVVTFVLDAWDPGALSVTWNVLIAGRWHHGIAQDNHAGFTWHVESAQISDPCLVAFNIVSPRAYHREAGPLTVDDQCSFTYRVLPDR
jgi:hypothetical protein